MIRTHRYTRHLISVASTPVVTSHNFFVRILTAAPSAGCHPASLTYNNPSTCFVHAYGQFANSAGYLCSAH